jgi:hypothetical protein
MKQKKITLCLVALLTVCNALFAEQSSYSKIVIYRNNASAENAYPYKILSNGTLLTELQNKNYFTFYMPEGILNLRAYYIVSADLQLPIVKNKSCYIRLDIQTVHDKQQAKMIVVDSLTATNEILSCKVPNIHNHIKNKLIPDNKIGFSLGAGWNFDKVPLIVTTSNSEASIGFGGGINAMISYTREFSDYFGMDFDLSTQTSSITPYLNNATVNFNRGCLSVNPFFIIPLQKDHRKRIKLGAGLDYYFTTGMNFETEKLKDGFNAEWTYNQPLGYNVTGMFEDIFRNNWSIHVGLKLCNVTYQFVSSNVNQYPSDQALGNPNGLGLFFLAGIGYHF